MGCGGNCDKVCIKKNYLNSLKKPSDLRKDLTEIFSGDIYITMEIQERLKDLIKEKGLRKVARELGIDHASLYRSLNTDLRWSRIKSILDHLGYDFEIVKKGGKNQGRKNHPGGKRR